jgi:hypothetical protein
MSGAICRPAFRGRHRRRDLAPSLDLERHEADFREKLIDMDVVCEWNELSRKSRFGARRPKVRPGSDRRKKPPRPNRVAREGKLAAGDALRISCGALSEAERPCLPEQLNGLPGPIRPATVVAVVAPPMGHRRQVPLLQRLCGRLRCSYPRHLLLGLPSLLLGMNSSTMTYKQLAGRYRGSGTVPVGAISHRLSLIKAGNSSS